MILMEHKDTLFSVLFVFSEKLHNFAADMEDEKDFLPQDKYARHTLRPTLSLPPVA